MIFYVNGEFLPEESARVSVLDRGFLYGDGLFETLRVYSGKPLRLNQHLERLQRGAGFLRLSIPSSPEIQGTVAELLRKNATRDAVLRINVSRGVGKRGYSIRDADRPSLVITMHEAPPAQKEPLQWRLITSPYRIGARDPLAGYKTSNKLVQILARIEAEDRNADEALLLTTDGNVAEAASGNIFWVDRGEVGTPPTDGILAGVTRAVMLELCRNLNLRATEVSIIPEQLNQMEGVFLTNSVQEIIEVVTFDNHCLATSPLVRRIADGYRELIQRELRP